MHGGQFRGRVDAEPVGEGAPRLLVHLQGVGLAPRRVQGAHQLAAQALAQRVRGGEGLQFGDRRGGEPGGDLGVDPVLHGGEPQFLQPRDGRVGEVGVGDVGEGGAAPQRERRAQAVRPRAGVLLGAGGGDAALERDRVDLAGVDPEPVARRAVLDHVPPGDAAQPGHQRLERVPAGRGALPQIVQQPLGRHGAARLGRQPHEEGSQPAARDLDGPRGPVPHVERSQDADAHACPLPGCHCPRCVDLTGRVWIPHAQSTDQGREEVPEAA